MKASDISDVSCEPSAIDRLTEEQKERLTGLLDQYLSVLGGGLPPAREDLLRRNPDLADLLAAYLDSLDELQDAAAVFSRNLLAAEAPEPSAEDRRLGDFRLIREIGRGGMGIVYEAQQISLGRRVALKVLPFAAVLDSRQIARFKHEAQAAAQLDHPNIVSVYAIGSDRGVHYFAMQLVDGQPLDRAIEELRWLSAVASATKASGATAPRDPSAAASLGTTRGSLLTTRSIGKNEYFRTVMQLAIQAAEALHAAHEYGVVHRDVKPSNLLLDSDGKLWVTDFGLARCQNNAALTRTGDLVGTVRYMSPEQVQGQSALIDQRTDVYSLGATLYELLVLQPAFPGDDGPQLLRRIAEQEPQALKSLQPKIPADLQTVVHKAMARRREDRYTTARELADDLRRVLEGKPTIARPPSIADRLGKWTRRHQRIVAAAVLVSMLATVGLATSTALISREKANTERHARRAQTLFTKAQDAVDRLGARAAQQLADVPAAWQVRRRLLMDTLSYYQGFVEDAKADLPLQRNLAMTYSKIATLAEGVGSTEDAIAAHQSALDIYEKLAAEEPAEARYRRDLAACHNNLGVVLAKSGRTGDAFRAYAAAIRLQKELAEDPATFRQFLDDLALSYTNLGKLQCETGDAKAAETSFRETIRLQETLLAAEPENPDYHGSLGAVYNNLSALYVDNQPAQAAELYEMALQNQRKAATQQPDEAEHQSAIALTYNNLGAVQLRLGQLLQAAESYAEAIHIQRELVRFESERNSHRRDLAVSLNNLGLVKGKLRLMPDAERCFQQALDLQEPLAKQDPRDVELRSSMGGVYNNRGIVLEELARITEAGESYAKAIEQQQAAYTQAPKISRYRVFLSKHYYNYGRVLRKLGRPDEAAQVAISRRTLWPDDPEHLLAIAEELALAGKLLAGRQCGEVSAEECEARAIETLQKVVFLGKQLPRDLDLNESFSSLRDNSQFAGLIGK